MARYIIVYYATVHNFLKHRFIILSNSPQLRSIFPLEYKESLEFKFTLMNSRVKEKYGLYLCR